MNLERTAMHLRGYFMHGCKTSHSRTFITPKITDNIHRDDRLVNETTLPELQKMNDVWPIKYLAWRDSVPDEWRRDGFLDSHLPSVVAKRFGQNEPIRVGDPLEADLWNSDRHWDKLSYVSLALATHIE
jgi:hypothetical protein